jgi:hypothetical protein
MRERIKVRSAWMIQFQDYVYLLAPGKYTGKIDWDTASHLFNIGKDCKEAAQQYVDNRKGDES